jgi:hypothetical protein
MSCNKSNIGFRSTGCGEVDEKLQSCEKSQETMKDVNAHRRKTGTRQGALGITEVTEDGGAGKNAGRQDRRNTLLAGETVFLRLRPEDR